MQHISFRLAGLHFEVFYLNMLWYKENDCSWGIKKFDPQTKKWA
jgi:hypothetical protein